MPDDSLQKLAVVMAVNCVRNTCIETYHAQGKLQAFFKVSPPAVHRMVLTLEKKRLIERTPGQARSIKVLVPVTELPRLT